MAGLTYGYGTSVSWIVSFFTTTTESIGFVQPIKVAVIAAVLTAIFNTPVKPADDVSHLLNFGVPTSLFGFCYTQA